MMRRNVTKQLGELLIERRVITREQLAKALAVQQERGGLLGTILVEHGYATEEDIAQAITAQYGFPYLPLANYEIEAQVVELVPVHVARQYCLIPIDRIGKSLSVAMANPLNIQAIEDIEMITECVVQTFVSTTSDVLRAIDQYYGDRDRARPDAGPTTG